MTHARRSSLSVERRRSRHRRASDGRSLDRRVLSRACRRRVKSSSSLSAIRADFPFNVSSIYTSLASAAAAAKLRPANEDDTVEVTATAVMGPGHARWPAGRNPHRRGHGRGSTTTDG